MFFIALEPSNCVNKYILSLCRSPVFRAMLEGPLAEDRGRLINIQVKTRNTEKYRKIHSKKDISGPKLKYTKKCRTSTRGLLRS